MRTTNRKSQIENRKSPPVPSPVPIDPRELTFAFVASSGPGGQNVNKVATAAQLRFDVVNSPSLPADVKARLTRLAGRRMTREGVLVIDARRHRTQERNHRDALERLAELLRLAATPPKPRRKTAPTAASRRRRQAAKVRRSRVKSLRRGVGREE